MNGIVTEIVRASESIDKSTKNVLVISDEICQHMNDYVDIMEVSGFNDEISQITGQINLLALNASIEAVRR